MFAAASAIFNKDIAINQGNLGDINECVKRCANTQNCVGIKMLYQDCYTAYKFDPYTAENCVYDGENCYSIMSKNFEERV